MTDDVRRLILAAKDVVCVGVNHVKAGTRLCSVVTKLDGAITAVEQQAADDDEPITWEWLPTLGFVLDAEEDVMKLEWKVYTATKEWPDRGTWKDYAIIFYRRSETKLRCQIRGTHNLPIKTRGQLRQLVALLKVE